MGIITDSHQISRLEVVDTGRRRRWTDEEKLRIVAESLSQPRAASATARRHGISRQQIFTWRRLHREGRLGALASFVPATITPEPPARAVETNAWEKSGLEVFLDYLRTLRKSANNITLIVRPVDDEA